MPDSTLPTKSDSITDFDRRHFTTYLRLLDAVDDGADWQDIAVTVIGVVGDGRSPEAKRTFDAFLARAQWMSERGYHHLASQDVHSPALGTGSQGGDVPVGAD